MARMAVTPAHIRQVITELLQSREPPATICPSEAARALAPDGWRALMPRVREVAIALAREGQLDIRQGGQNVAPDGPLRGPIRLGRPVLDAKTTAQHRTPVKNTPCHDGFARPEAEKD